MAPGQISRQYKPTGSVDGSSFRSQESRRSRQSDRLSRKAAPQDSNISTGDDGHEGDFIPSPTYYLDKAWLNNK